MSGEADGDEVRLLAGPEGEERRTRIDDDAAGWLVKGRPSPHQRRAVCERSTFRVCA